LAPSVSDVLLPGVFEGAIFSPALYAVQVELGTTEVLANASIAAYTVATALAPLLWASLSELKGRKPIYLFSLAICLIASIALIFTPELGIVWLIVWRVIQGCGACAAFSVGAGTISDCYRVEQRGRAFGLNSLGPLLGALIGPPSEFILCFRATAAAAPARARCVDVLDSADVSLLLVGGALSQFLGYRYVFVITAALTAVFVFG
jgi:MFS family permease